MKLMAIIPARGGSKRIPNKNIKLFAGLPIIAHSIRAAQKSNLFERIMVSTDSPQIAEISIKYGAEAPFMRPSELADDHTGTAEVVAHALSFLADKGELPEVSCCIYATAPFLKPEFLERGLKAMIETNARGAFAVAAFSASIFRALRREKDGRVHMLWPEYRISRSQDLPEAVHDAGQFYWFRSEPFLADQNLFADAVGVVLPRWVAQDIDTESDWNFAELMHKALSLQGEIA